MSCHWAPLKGVWHHLLAPTFEFFVSIGELSSSIDGRGQGPAVSPHEREAPDPSTSSWLSTAPPRVAPLALRSPEPTIILCQTPITFHSDECSGGRTSCTGPSWGPRQPPLGLGPDRRAGLGAGPVSPTRRRGPLVLEFRAGRSPRP